MRLAPPGVHWHFPRVLHPSSSPQPCPTLSHALFSTLGVADPLVQTQSSSSVAQAHTILPRITLQVLHSLKVFNGHNPGLLLGKMLHGSAVCHVSSARL